MDILRTALSLHYTVFLQNREHFLHCLESGKETVGTEEATNVHRILLICFLRRRTQQGALRRELAAPLGWTPSGRTISSQRGPQGWDLDLGLFSAIFLIHLSKNTDRH